jgi:hypothetical protein
MKMGNIASPWRYDVGTLGHATVARTATTRDPVLRLNATRILGITTKWLPRSVTMRSGRATRSRAHQRAGGDA